MKAAILQPSYLPWSGFFDLIDRADVFIFLDDVAYDRHGWRNRTRIKTSHGTEWLTIPVEFPEDQSIAAPINAVGVSWDVPWNRRHWDRICQSYETAPFFESHAPYVETIFWDRSTLLADLVITSTITLAKELGITQTRFLRSSALPASGMVDGWLLELLTQAGADEYLSIPSARDAGEVDKLRAAGIRVETIGTQFPEYTQLYPPFDPQVTVLDLLFMLGPRGLGHLRQGRA
jgi:hypothetical protein